MLNKTLKKKNIIKYQYQANLISKEITKTDGLLEALNQKEAPGNRNALNFIHQFKEANSALNRLPEVEDIAELVYFLASSSAKSITGQCINIDCGVFPQ